MVFTIDIVLLAEITVSRLRQHCMQSESSWWSPQFKFSPFRFFTTWFVGSFQLMIMAKLRIHSVRNETDIGNFLRKNYFNKSKSKHLTCFCTSWYDKSRKCVTQRYESKYLADPKFWHPVLGGDFPLITLLGALFSPQTAPAYKHQRELLALVRSEGLRILSDKMGMNKCPLHFCVGFMAFILIVSNLNI